MQCQLLARSMEKLDTLVALANFYPHPVTQTCVKYQQECCGRAVPIAQRSPLRAPAGGGGGEALSGCDGNGAVSASLLPSSFQRHHAATHCCCRPREVAQGSAPQSWLRGRGSVWRNMRRHAAVKPLFCSLCFQHIRKTVKLRKEVDLSPL